MLQTSAFEVFTAALTSLGCDERESCTPGRSMFRCPAHDDNVHSLSVAESDDGNVLFHCFAGCSPDEILAAAKLTWRDLYGVESRVAVQHYVYEDESGPLYRVTRYVPKSFSQSHWDGAEWQAGVPPTVRRVPYRLPQLVSAPPSDVVYVVEGEKDADVVAARGYVATTFVGGAGAWRPEYGRYFVGRSVVVVADADEPGRAGAHKIAAELRKVASTVSVVVPKVGKDATDHFRAGYDVGDFVPEGEGLDEFGPLDWTTYEVQETEWLLKPYVPRAARVLVFGPAKSLKSLWALWLAAHVAKSGGKVAYFSLEMLPSTTAQRLKRLDPPKDRFVCFTRNFRLGSPTHTQRLISALRDYDLIVIDSWTAARKGTKDTNEDVAELDTDFFLPVIQHTGATVLVLDNTGHPAVTDRGVVKMEHARGASAKHDKMDVTIFFDRPYADNNYMTTIRVKDVRLDYPIPKPVNVWTPQDDIEFYYEDGTPLWPGLTLGRKSEDLTNRAVAEARLKAQFGAVEC